MPRRPRELIRATYRKGVLCGQAGGGRRSELGPRHLCLYVFGLRWLKWVFKTSPGGLGESLSLDATALPETVSETWNSVTLSTGEGPRAWVTAVPCPSPRFGFRFFSSSCYNRGSPQESNPDLSELGLNREHFSFVPACILNDESWAADSKSDMLIHADRPSNSVCLCSWWPDPRSRDAGLATQRAALALQDRKQELHVPRPAQSPPCSTPGEGAPRLQTASPFHPAWKTSGSYLKGSGVEYEYVRLRPRLRMTLAVRIIIFWAWMTRCMKGREKERRRGKSRQN